MRMICTYIYDQQPYVFDLTTFRPTWPPFAVLTLWLMDERKVEKMTVTRFELARETHHGDWLIPKRDAVTTWLHCR